MSEYKHRMTVIVPFSLIEEANHLALLAGESELDIETFRIANWRDSQGNLFSVCSTVVKPIVLAMFGAEVSEIPLEAEGVDLYKAQQALLSSDLYEEGYQITPERIIIAIDREPLQLFSTLGLQRIEDSSGA